MGEAALKYMDNLMQGMGIPYAFLQWNSGIPPDCYFVGDYIEEPSLTKEENGFQRSTFILSGFTRKEWLLLERTKETLENGLPQTAILENGSGIAVFYESARPMPTDDGELKIIKINLTIQEWKVNGNDNRK